MNVNRIIQVNDGNTLQAVRNFIILLWRKNNIAALLAPIENLYGGIDIQVLTDPNLINGLNPYAPFMPSNTAGLVADFINDHPGENLAILFRPCELRAFNELFKKKRLPAKIEEVIIIGVDCLGTFRREEFQKRLEKNSLNQLTFDALKHAAIGENIPINPNYSQTFRTACSICDLPAPLGAHITIGTIGVTSDQSLLVIASDEDTDVRLNLESLTMDKFSHQKLANEYQVSHRETVIGAISDSRNKNRAELVADMHSENRFNDLGSLLAIFYNCSVCGECMKVCPIENGNLNNLLPNRQAIETRHTPQDIVHPQDKNHPLADLVALSHWLASCSGCGMCEQTCEHDVPLSILISALSHRIRSETHYQAGIPDHLQRG